MAEQEIVILAGHGSSEREAGDLEDVARRVHGMMHPGCTQGCVRAAYLQFMTPGLAGAIDNAVHQGAKKIIIHPYFLASGYHVTRHIPGIIADARQRHPGVELMCTAPLGGHEKLAEVVLDRIVSAVSQPKHAGGASGKAHE